MYISYYTSDSFHCDPLVPSFFHNLHTIARKQIIGIGCLSYKGCNMGTSVLHWLYIQFRGRDKFPAVKALENGLDWLLKVGSWNEAGSMI